MCLLAASLPHGSQKIIFEPEKPVSSFPHSIYLLLSISLTSLFHSLSHFFMSACHCLFYYIILFLYIIALLSALAMPYTLPTGLSRSEKETRTMALDGFKVQ